MTSSTEKRERKKKHRAYVFRGNRVEMGKKKRNMEILQQTLLYSRIGSLFSPRARRLTIARCCLHNVRYLFLRRQIFKMSAQYSPTQIYSYPVKIVIFSPILFHLIICTVILVIGIYWSDVLRIFYPT